MTFLLVIGLPILLLIILAAMAAMVAFAVLAGLNLFIGLLRGAAPRNDGRRNVRVIRKADSVAP